MTARAVSKHRRVCGQNYGQIPVLAQKKSPVTGMVTGLFTVRSPQFGYFAFHSPFPQTANQRSVYDLKRMHSGSGVFCIDETDVKSSIACKKENVCKATLVRIPLLFNKAHRKRTIYKAKSKQYQQKENILSDVLFLLASGFNSDILSQPFPPSIGRSHSDNFCPE